MEISPEELPDDFGGIIDEVAEPEVLPFQSDDVIGDIGDTPDISFDPTDLNFDLGDGFDVGLDPDVDDVTGEAPEGFGPGGCMLGGIDEAPTFSWRELSGDDILHIPFGKYTDAQEQKMREEHRERVAEIAQARASGEGGPLVGLIAAVRGNSDVFHPPVAQQPEGPSVIRKIVDRFLGNSTRPPEEGAAFDDVPQPEGATDDAPEDLPTSLARAQGLRE